MIDKTPSIAEIAEQIEAHKQREAEDVKRGIPSLRIVDYITQLPRDEVAEAGAWQNELMREWNERLDKDREARLGDVPLFKSVEKSFKSGELMLFASGPGYSMLKRREFSDKAQVVFIDIDYSPGEATQQFQRMSRLLRQLTRHASRRYREGQYIGSRAGKAYRSRIIMRSYPNVGSYQVEQEVWRRVDLG